MSRSHRFLVVVPRAASESKEQLRKDIRYAIIKRLGVQAKVSSLSESDRVVTENGFDKPLKSY